MYRTRTDLNAQTELEIYEVVNRHVPRIRVLYRTYVLYGSKTSCLISSYFMFNLLLPLTNNGDTKVLTLGHNAFKLTSSGRIHAVCIGERNQVRVDANSRQCG
jgi:hypothetical protein